MIYVLVVNLTDNPKIYLHEHYDTNIAIIATVRLSRAMIFETEAHAKEQRVAMYDTSWEIMPLQDKQIFEAKLKGK